MAVAQGKEKEKPVTTLTVAKCSHCGGQFPLSSELLDCGLRCPHCKTVAKVLPGDADGAEAAHASTGRAPGAWASSQPRRLHICPPTAPRRTPLMLTVLGSPGVIIAVVGVAMLVIATLVMSMSIMGEP